jgi:hypothetical protein
VTPGASATPLASGNPADFTSASVSLEGAFGPAKEESNLGKQCKAGKEAAGSKVDKLEERQERKGR